ncbi:MAG: hypothetical protein ACHQ1D_02935 [Nitrososphaerales archaeon]
MIKFENRSNGRFYYIGVKKDLFGDLVIHIIRGGANVSVSRLIFCDNDRTVREEIRRISKLRISRGYTLVE